MKDEKLIVTVPKNADKSYYTIQAGAKNSQGLVTITHGPMINETSFKKVHGTRHEIAKIDDSQGHDQLIITKITEVGIHDHDVNVPYLITAVFTNFETVEHKDVLDLWVSVARHDKNEEPRVKDVFVELKDKIKPDLPSEGLLINVLIRN